MRGWGGTTLALAALLLTGGCRTATRVKDVPRVDLEFSGSGNRGYLLGQAPAAGTTKTTRQMVETDVELPSFYRPKPSGRTVTLDTVPSEPDAETAPRRARQGRFDTYVVQKGESLWTIAAKPEVYGKASQWRRLYDANRDLLKTPDSIKPGMTLTVPRGAAADGDAGSDDGATYHK